MKMTLEEAIRQIVDSYMQSVHTAIPAVITSYDSKKQSAQIRPLINQTYFNGKSIALPIIVNVPIIFPHNKICGLKFPLKVGDTVLAIFSESCLERWLSSDSGAVDMGYNRRFDLSDAIAIPCVFSLNSAQFGADNEQGDFILIHNGAKILLKEDGTIVIESNNNAMITLENDNIMLSNNSGAAISLNGSSLAMKNTSDDLLKILNDLCQTLYVSTVQTHNFDNKNDFNSLKNRINLLQ
jgi:hypothetical protein